MSEHLGIHITITTSASSSSSGEPEIFTPAQNDTEVVLAKAAKKVVVFLNGKIAIQTSIQVPDGDFTHVTNSTTITFGFNLADGDVVLVIPFY